MNTIFAQCSAKGKAGVCVFRISGSSALTCAQILINDVEVKLKPRYMYYKKIYNPKNKQHIDDVMIVYFKGQSSFTGEDSVEIFTHGSIAVIKIMHEVLSSLDDVRHAEPGEFAKRSFLNGKMDLTAAEGLADLIEAETQLQHKQAIMQLGGGLEKIYELWRIELLKIISLVEAYIDFPDEGIPDDTIDNIVILVDKIIAEIRLHLNDNHRGERLRSGIKMAIIGAPNAGKSSLLNYLMKRELAIVSNIAGTTRDIIEGHLDIGGYPIIVQDTAGIHDGSLDIIEQEGILRARQVASSADIKILVLDVNEIEKDKEFFQEIIDDNTIIVFNKIDLITKEIPNVIYNRRAIKISIKNNIGLNGLLDEIITISNRLASPSDSPQITRARHRSELEKALDYMSSFSLNEDLVLAAEDLRMTIRVLSNITGKITVDEILGEIFSNFCIGK